MSSIAIQYYTTPLGELIIGVYEHKLCLCDWRYREMRTAIDQRIQRELQASYIEQEHELIEATIQQIAAYFSADQKTFSIPLLFCGTAFQQEVWQALMNIPYGETLSYLQLSQQLGNEKAIRAVASANGANALALFVPCHRVIGTDGALTRLCRRYSC